MCGGDTNCPSPTGLHINLRIHPNNMSYVQSKYEKIEYGRKYGSKQHSDNRWFELISVVNIFYVSTWFILVNFLPVKEVDFVSLLVYY